MSAPQPRNALRRLAKSLRDFEPRDHIAVGGIITQASPSFFRVGGLSRFAAVGDRVRLSDEAGTQGEIIQIDETGALVKPYTSAASPTIGAEAFRVGAKTIAPSQTWRGRVINALCEPIDGAGPLEHGARVAQIDALPPPALQRARIDTSLRTGVRAIDIFAPLCVGQRIGVFAGSGVGKSTLLGMLARAKGFDVVVVGLIGERGREVREFLEDALNVKRQDAVTVVATGDESALMRRLAARTAVAVAEWFRDEGASVLLIVDSITRYAQAAREIAISAGDPPVARGFPPNVFADLPQLLERAGPGLTGVGSITGFFAVLVDGDDHNDPIADAVRGALDGHIVLDRAIAAQGRYPAIDILASLSRLSHLAWSAQETILVQRLRAMAARYEDTRDLRAMGGYQPGLDKDLDSAVNITPRLYDALRQAADAPQSANAFADIADALRAG